MRAGGRVVMKGMTLTGQVLKKSFYPHPLQVGFAVLHTRGHGHWLSPHQAPGTVLSALRAYSHLILAATL